MEEARGKEMRPQYGQRSFLTDLPTGRAMGLMGGVFAEGERTLLQIPSFDLCRYDHSMARTLQVFRYRIRNWCPYNRALINRGRLTVWFDEQAVAAWRNTEPAAGPGAPRVYADLAIECALVFKAVYHRVTRRQRTLSNEEEEVMLH